jgi:hypothetical protein
MHHYMSANCLACVVVLFVADAAYAAPRKTLGECFAKCRATGNACLKIPAKEDPRHDRMCTVNYYKCSDLCKITRGLHI